MKVRHLGASLLVTSALISGCNDSNSRQASDYPAPVTPPVVPVPAPSPIAKTFSEFAASLIAMVMGTGGTTGCDTATPADLNGVTTTDDMNAQDANTITVNCT